MVEEVVILGCSRRLLGQRGNCRAPGGDTVVVPEDLERLAWLKEVKDVATILGNFAMTAGAVMAAIK